MSNTHLDRATILTEALPYIQRYNGKIVVVNCGGVAMNQELRDAVATDITLLRLVGVKVVLVHGIGPEVRQALKDAGKELPVVDGFPQVNESAIDLVQETLCGKVNKTLVATLNKLGAKAIGLCGIDGGFLTAKSAGGDHPCTGELVQVDGGLLEDFLSKGYTPVVATIAQGAEDPTQVYSVSANHTAAKLAVQVGLGEKRTNNILQAAFFALTKVIPLDVAVEDMKKNNYNSYFKKAGQEIVDKNDRAVDVGINAAIVGDLLTTVGSRFERDRVLFQEAGYSLNENTDWAI